MIAAMAIEVIVWFYLIIISAMTVIAAGLIVYARRRIKEYAPQKDDRDEDNTPEMAPADTDGGDMSGRRAPRKIWWFRLPDFSDRVVRVRLFLLGGLAVIMWLFSMALIIPASSNVLFCGQACHNMNPEYQTWKVSSHSKITCTACHVDPTLYGLAYEKIVEGPLGLLHTVTESHEKPINEASHVSQEKLPAVRCERCHANENRKFTFSSGIYMDHKAHGKAGIQCAVCHNRVTHLGAEEFEPLKSEWEEAEEFKFKNYLTMKDGCFRCHSSNKQLRDEHALHLIKNHKEPPSACKTCHTKEFKKMPLGHANGDWRDKHGAEVVKNLKYCLTCHEAGAKFDHEGTPWCLVCHDEAQMTRFRAKYLAK